MGSSLKQKDDTFVCLSQNEVRIMNCFPTETQLITLDYIPQIEGLSEYLNWVTKDQTDNLTYLSLQLFFIRLHGSCRRYYRLVHSTPTSGSFQYAPSCAKKLITTSARFSCRNLQDSLIEIYFKDLKYITNFLVPILNTILFKALHFPLIKQCL